MIWLIGICIVAAVGWLDFATIRAIRRQPWQLPWVVAATVLLGISLPLSVWLAFIYKYYWRNDLQFIGFPIPLLVLQLEHGQWVDFVGNPFLGLVSVFLIISASLWPVSLGLVGAWIWRKLHRRTVA